jgi:endoglycosylceramidase
VRPLAIALLALLPACSAEPPRWHVAGGFLRDPDGRAVILHGVNVSDAQKRPPYLDFHQAADYARLPADWGFDAVRFVMPWAALEPERDRYDDTYLEELARRLDWAHAAGLVVVLDLHQDIYGEGFGGGDGAPRWTCDEARYAAFQPHTPWFFNYLDDNVMACVDQLWTSDELQRHLLGAWRRVAQRLGRHPAVIGFDAFNEPHWGSYPLSAFEADRLAPFYEKVVQTVRAEAPDWVAFLEPSSSRNAGYPTGLPRFGFRDVVYAPHSYDQTAESGGGFDPSRRDAILDNMAALADEARALSAALWIGEYGGVAAQPGIGEYMDAEYDAAGAVAAGTMYWEYGADDGYGLVDAARAEKPALADALARPYPERVAGDPISYAFDETTGAFTLVFRPSAGAAPTELVLPARRYGPGASVECGGCQVERVEGRVRLGRVAPSGGLATVVIRP